MGLEAECEVRLGRRVGRGTARLEPTGLSFRGEFRFEIPRADIRSFEAKHGTLEVTWAGGKAHFVLGAAARAWEVQIRYPRSRMEKLGVKPGVRVLVVGLDDEALLEELRLSASKVTMGRAAGTSDIVLALMGVRTDLRNLKRLRRAILPNGALWAVWRKGRPELRESDVRAAALEAGLVDVKVVSISETLSGLKLVVPVVQRGGKS